MTVRKFKALLVVAAATATTLAAPVAAVAATTAPFAPTHAVAAHAVKHGFNINGYNWGGMAATGSGFTSVAATWTEPTATCNSTNDLYAPWVGIDGYGSS